jgi:hypothetical protein
MATKAKQVEKEKHKKERHQGNRIYYIALQRPCSGVELCRGGRSLQHCYGGAMDATSSYKSLHVATWGVVASSLVEVVVPCRGCSQSVELCNLK